MALLKLQSHSLEVLYYQRRVSDLVNFLLILLLNPDWATVYNPLIWRRRNLNISKLFAFPISKQSCKCLWMILQVAIWNHVESCSFQQSSWKMIQIWYMFSQPFLWWLSFYGLFKSWVNLRWHLPILGLFGFNFCMSLIHR